MAGAVQMALTSTSRFTASSCSALPAPAFSLSVPKGNALVLAACTGSTVRMREKLVVPPRIGHADAQSLDGASENSRSHIKLSS